MKSRIIALSFMVALLMCIAGILASCLVAGADKDGSGPAPVNVTTTGTPRAAVKASPTATPTNVINGNDVVRVGEDVPAGTYRAVTPVEPGTPCYWVKSKNAEADISSIIDNGVPTGGRPQVTLKTGQWFTSQGCPDWALRK
jgi:hypothetical protein